MLAKQKFSYSHSDEKEKINLCYFITYLDPGYLTQCQINTFQTGNDTLFSRKKGIQRKEKKISLNSLNTTGERFFLNDPLTFAPDLKSCGECQQIKNVFFNSTFIPA